MIQSCLKIFALDSLTTGKTLIGMFLPHNVVHSMYPNFSDKIQFRLKTVNEIKDYFIAEIRQKEAISKGISKYIAAIDYFDKAFIDFSEASGGVSIASFANVIHAPAGTGSTSFRFAFSIITTIVTTTRNKKKNHNKVVMLARSKLNRNKNNNISSVNRF